MRSFQIILILLSGLTITTAAENVLIINSAFARPGDTITVSASITNTERFISFQFDLPLPEYVSFLTNSMHMSERGTDHAAIGNMAGSNLLRIFSYSPSNAAFQGNSGEVVSFQLVVGNIRGELPMIIEDGIIGDSISQNIITGSENGMLSVFPLGLENRSFQGSSFVKGMTIFPNPVKVNTWLKFDLLSECEVTFRIFDRVGKELQSVQLGILIPGVHQIDITKFTNGLKLSGVYYLELYVPPSINQSPTKSYNKSVIPLIINE